MMGDIGKLEGLKYLNTPDKPKFYCLNRSELEPPFFTNFISTVGDSIHERLILLSMFDETNNEYPCQILIAGDQDLVQKSGNL